MSEWQQTTFGAVLNEVSRAVQVSDLTKARYAGVRWYAGGVYDRETVSAEKIKGKTLYLIKLDDIVYNRMWATKGSFGVAKADVDGCFVTNDFPVFTAIPNVILPNYVEAVFHTTSFRTEAASRAAGTTERRRLHARDFAKIPILLPPLSVQERIVGIIGAVDNQIAALDAEAEAAMQFLGGLLNEFTGTAGDTKPLRELCPVIGSGPSWEAKDESSLQSDGSWTVLKITNTRPDGSIDLKEMTYVVGLPASTKVIGPTSLVMIRTNGNRGRIGNVYLPPEEVHGAAVSAFQFTLDATDVETRNYLYLALRSPRIQHRMSESASGSTGLGNLAVRWLKTLEIPWPDAEVRVVQIESVQAVDTKVTAIRAEAASLREVRAGLLSGVLDRTIEIESAELEV
jgi:type I restriction enzyme S subunit